MSAGDRQWRPSALEPYEELIERLARMFLEVSERRLADPERFRRWLDSEPEVIEVTNGLFDKHPRVLEDALARVEIEELVEKNCFERALEELRRDSHREWPEREPRS